MGTGVNRHQDDENRLQPAARAPRPQATHCASRAAPGLLLCWDMCRGCKRWPMADLGSRELGQGQATWEKLQGSRGSRGGAAEALLFPKVMAIALNGINYLLSAK